MRYSAALQGISNKMLLKKETSTTDESTTDQLPSKNQAVTEETNKQVEIGDIVKVGVRIQEGKKQRIQPYSRTVIAQHGNGLNSTFTVRRIFQGVGIERVFLKHSTCSAFVEIVRKSRVRRAKLYYLRDRVGKRARLKTKLV